MKTRARALCLCLAAAILCALPVDALGAVKQRSVTLSEKLFTIDLAQGSTYQLTGKVNPSNANQSMVWKSGKPSVATISQTGLVTGRTIGAAIVGARPSSNKNWAKAIVKVIDSLAPTSISMNVPSLSLSVGSTYQLSATAYPASAMQAVSWTSSRTSVATVSSDGLVTAKSAGAILIRAASKRNTRVSRVIKVTVKNLPAPSKLTVSPADTKMEKGATLQLSAVGSPEGTNPAVVWTISSSSIARISQTGLVTALKTGIVKIKAASLGNSRVYTVRTLTIVDSKAVTSVTIADDDLALRVGSTLPLTATVLPANANPDITWSSNNTNAATVSSSGVVTGKGSGNATITVTAGGKTDSVRVVVQSKTPVTEEPAQVTSVADINKNLALIDSIMRYATTELDALYVSGLMSSGEATARKTIIANAFRMARFPWMSKTEISYWSANSGSYRSNVVYFGIPYTQNNRRFNVAKLLDAGAFKQLSGNNYFTAYIKDNVYPGNDCSSFVSMSQWGTGSSYSYLRSWEVKTSPAYKTVASTSNKTGYKNLRPGDLFVRYSGSGGHVVMFLYYAKSDMSKIMVIQQGGGDTLNTVSCDLKDLGYYSGNSTYIARRKTTFK